MLLFWSRWLSSGPKVMMGSFHQPGMRKRNSRCPTLVSYVTCLLSCFIPVWLYGVVDIWTFRTFSKPRWLQWMKITIRKLLRPPSKFLLPVELVSLLSISTSSSFLWTRLSCALASRNWLPTAFYNLMNWGSKLTKFSKGLQGICFCALV